MKLSTLKSKLNEANQRFNNKNAKRFIDSIVDKFNKSQNKFKCSYPGEVFNFGWVDLEIESDNHFETIRISLP